MCDSKTLYSTILQPICLSVSVSLYLLVIRQKKGHNLPNPPNPHMFPCARVHGGARTYSMHQNTLIKNNIHNG